MPTSLIVTIIASDRPGLVSAISDIAAAHGANWAESLMSHIAGQFAGILHLQAPPENRERLMAALDALNAQGFNLQIVAASDGSERAEARRLQLDLVGQDRPGIVREISAALAALGVSIEKLATRIESGAMSGECMFEAHAQLRVPLRVADDALRSALEAIANEMMVDLALVNTADR